MVCVLVGPRIIFFRSCPLFLLILPKYFFLLSRAFAPAKVCFSAFLSARIDLLPAVLFFSCAWDLGTRCAPWRTSVFVAQFSFHATHARMENSLIIDRILWFTSRSGLRHAGPKKGLGGWNLSSFWIFLDFFLFLDETPGLLGREVTLRKLALSCLWVVVCLSDFWHSLSVCPFFCIVVGCGLSVMFFNSFVSAPYRLTADQETVFCCRSRLWVVVCWCPFWGFHVLQQTDRQTDSRTETSFINKMTSRSGLRRTGPNMELGRWNLSSFGFFWILFYFWRDSGSPWSGGDPSQAPTVVCVGCGQSVTFFAFFVGCGLSFSFLSLCCGLWSVGHFFNSFVSAP